MEKNFEEPRNKIKFMDIFEVFRYTFSLQIFKEMIFSFGYFIHDKVASKAKLHIASEAPPQTYKVKDCFSGGA